MRAAASGAQCPRAAQVEISETSSLHSRELDGASGSSNSVCKPKARDIPRCKVRSSPVAQAGVDVMYLSVDICPATSASAAGRWM